MGHFEGAKQLIEHSRKSLQNIEDAYKNSLQEKEIKPELLVEIKNFLENLRSALDFSAQGLFTKYGSSSKKNLKIYFPYAYLGQSLEDFHRDKRIDNCIPGLAANRPDIVATLESYQHFANKFNAWLPSFMDLNNENKHKRLTPQIPKDTKELRISSGEASISLRGDVQIFLGPRSLIQIGDMTVPGGQTFGTNIPPVTVGLGIKEVITWVSFYFESNDQPVLPFLKQALVGCERIINELSEL